MSSFFFPWIPVCTGMTIHKDATLKWVRRLIILAAIFAQALEPALAQGPQPARPPRHFLWSVETTSNTVYLLGSIHLLGQDSYPLAPEIEAAYRSSKKIVFETDLQALQDPAWQAALMNKGLLPDGQTLRQQVTDSTYRLLEKRMAAAGLGIAMFEQSRPWLCGMMLVGMELQRLGFDRQLGIDAHFFGRARADGKQLLFLEKPDEQLNLIAGLGGSNQEEFLLQTLSESQTVTSMATEIISLWKSGDDAGLEKILNAGFKEHPDIYERFITRRNRNWFARIQDLIMQADNALVIVGAGHLAGATGLLQLLRQKGFHVEQR
jgi:hypothetical protein